MIEIVAKKVTVYQVNGRGKTYRQRKAAYLGAAFALVNEMHLEMHEVEHWSEISEKSPCRFCSKECEGHKSLRHFAPATNSYWEDGEEPAAKCVDHDDPKHTYRYRLIGRLARWLQWHDERRENGKAAV